jgi:hypothetical protein
LEQKLNDLLPAELRESVFQSGIPLLGLKSNVLLALAGTMALLMAVTLMLFRPSAETGIETIPQDPTHVKLTVVIPPASKPPVTQTPANAYGLLQVAFDVARRNPVYQVSLQNEQSGQVITRRLQSYSGR